MKFNPTAVDLATLPWLPLEDRSAFPKRACIYFAIDSLGTVQYIGRSVNARQRWSQHHKYEDLTEVGGVKIAYLFIDAPELLPEIEKALITHFQPPFNVVGRVQVKEFTAAEHPDVNDADSIAAIAKKRIQLNLRLDGYKELYEALKAEAARQNTSVNSFVIKTLRKALKETDKSPHA